ncbi:hypothetical protein G7061_06730 [Erysipelothrix sp. HDW6B]|uniref:hypothetical protein n=1 Tax=Erysipelothrix TaxID=1647 RepID=UPI00140C3988|nr:MULTISPECIES: hypothetical protein [Erysipelothrix]QIK86325.1 hypothetical protein G7061_06730 [Erysipelothrix sp. HDW6B]
MDQKQYNDLINHHIDYQKCINGYLAGVSKETLLSLKYMWGGVEKQLFDAQLFDRNSVVSTYSSFVYFYPNKPSNKARCQEFVKTMSDMNAFSRGDLSAQLNFDTVFFALNAGSGGENYYFSNFENFHYNGAKPSASKAYSLHKFIFNERSHLHGAYITDAFKGLATSNGSELKSAFKQISKVCPNFESDIINAYVDAIIEELTVLRAKPKVIYYLGKTDLLNKFMSVFKKKWPHHTELVNIYHYCATGVFNKDINRVVSRNDNWKQYIK